MCKVISVSNQKGGVAKSSTTLNLGIGLASINLRELQKSSISLLKQNM